MWLLYDIKRQYLYFCIVSRFSASKTLAKDYFAFMLFLLSIIIIDLVQLFLAFLLIHNGNAINVMRISIHFFSDCITLHFEDKIFGMNKFMNENNKKKQEIQQPKQKEKKVRS